MKNCFNAAIILIGAIATSAWADTIPHANSEVMHHGPMIANMQDMHKHLHTMENIMEQVHRATSNKERNQLMEKHMQEMQITLSMMAPTMNMMDGKQKHMTTNQVVQNQQLMDQRIDMMQQIIQHMIFQQNMLMHQRGRMEQ